MALMETFAPTTVIIDGTIEQRAELAQLIGELRDESVRIQTALEFAKAQLRELMQGHPDPKQRVLSVKSAEYEIRLKPNYDVVCAQHRCPIRACHLAHRGEPVPVTVVEFARYFHIKRIGESDDAAGD